MSEFPAPVRLGHNDISGQWSVRRVGNTGDMRRLTQRPRGAIAVTRIMMYRQRLSRLRGATGVAPLHPIGSRAARSKRGGRLALFPFIIEEGKSRAL